MDCARRRLLFILGTIVVCFIAIEIRLFHLQIVDHPTIREAADSIYRTGETVLGSRGKIVTRNGYALAESISALDIYADSRWTVGHRDEIAAALDPYLDDQDVRAGLRTRLDEEGYRRLLVHPLFDGERILEIRRLKRDGKLRGLDLERTWLRSHPEGSLAANLVGYVNAEGKGQAGIELAFDSLLSGSSGRQEQRRDAAQRRLFKLDAEPSAARMGHDVRLTIDLVLQYFAEEAMEQVVAEYRPEWCSTVVMDPKTGEILAMASRPSFDPNRYGEFPIDAYRNPAVSFQYTPGSAFKPFIMAEALKQQGVRLDEHIDCSSFQYGRRVIRDSHHNDVLTPAEVIIKSSNIGMAKIALRLVPDPTHPREAQLAGFRRIRETLTELGFGRATHLGLVAEAEGNLRPASQWTHTYTLPSIAFGHEITVSPVQMAAAFCAFANGGMYLEPYLIEAVIDADGRSQARPPRAIRRVIDPVHADTIRDMLIRVVDEGTGEEASIDGYSVAGKTSTAQWEKDSSKYTSSFVGFAPASDPRLLVLVVVDQPKGALHSGGKVAAPAARNILEKGLAYLRIPHDRKALSSR